MGQAKRRGTFEERKAQAIARWAELTEQYRKNMQDPAAELPESRQNPEAELPFRRKLDRSAAELPESRQNPETELPFRRKLGRSFTGIQMAAAIASMGGWGR